MVWYDEIALLKPACIKENGYRYYDYHQSATLETILKGKYLRAFCKDNWRNIPHRYEELLTYAKAHHFQFSGFAYEKGINEFVIDSLDDYITQIEIPIKTEL